MRLDTARLIPYFDSQTPVGLLERIVEIILRSYESAFDHCDGSFASPEAHDLIGHYRRATIETALGALEASFPIDVPKPTNATDSAHHAEVRYRNTVLTQHKIEKERAPIPHAEFRATLAIDSTVPMFYIPPEMGDPSSLWAAVVHGSRRPLDRVPAFLRVVFPDETGRHAYRPSVDLFARFASLRPKVADLAPQTTVLSQPEDGVRIRPEVLPKQDEEEAE